MRVSLAEEEPITRPKGLLKGQSSVPLGRTAGGFRLGSEQLGVGTWHPPHDPGKWRQMSPEAAAAAATSARRNATVRCVRSLFDEALASYDVSWLSC